MRQSPVSTRRCLASCGCGAATRGARVVRCVVLPGDPAASGNRHTDGVARVEIRRAESVREARPCADRGRHPRRDRRCTLRIALAHESAFRRNPGGPVQFCGGLARAAGRYRCCVRAGQWRSIRWPQSGQSNATKRRKSRPLPDVQPRERDSKEQPQVTQIDVPSRERSLVRQSRPGRTRRSIHGIGSDDGSSIRPSPVLPIGRTPEMSTLDQVVEHSLASGVTNPKQPRCLSHV
jgi:hypothetical protein